MKKFLSLLLACLLAATLCVPALSEASKTNIVFWHSMGGSLGEVILSVAQQFNDSQDKITIEPQYQGSYEESINKLKTAMRTKAGPDVIQVYEGGTRFMAGSGFITPMQDLIEKYGLDISSLEPNILAYYTVDGKLNSMPFNTSVPLLYYNKTLLSELGYPDGPRDWAEIKEIALKVVERKDAAIPYGFATADMWFFEQPLVMARVPMVNNDNGRSAPATECVLDQNELPLKLMQALNDMRQTGALADLGFNSSDIAAAFTSGMAAMTVASTAGLRNYLNTIGDRFELGTCFLPPYDRSMDNGGVTLGGASLYVPNNGKGEAMEQAIIEFVRFMMKPETQAYWHVNTGYYPITTQAYELDIVKENLVKYPHFNTAIDQLHASRNMGFGAIYGSFVEGRTVYKQYMEEMWMGQISPEEALANTVADINVLIENYNASNQ